MSNTNRKATVFSRFNRKRQGRLSTIPEVHESEATGERKLAQTHSACYADKIRDSDGQSSSEENIPPPKLAKKPKRDPFKEKELKCSASELDTHSAKAHLQDKPQPAKGMRLAQPSAALRQKPADRAGLEQLQRLFPDFIPRGGVNTDNTYYRRMDERVALNSDPIVRSWLMLYG